MENRGCSGLPVRSGRGAVTATIPPVCRRPRCLTPALPPLFPLQILLTFGILSLGEDKDRGIAMCVLGSISKPRVFKSARPYPVATPAPPHVCSVSTW